MLFYGSRLIGHSVAARLRSDISPLDATVDTGRAWPWSCDFNLHVNNAQYLTLMDISRTHWFVRSGVGMRMLRQRQRALVAGSTLLYRRSIDLMRPYGVRTQPIASDGDWLYVASDFVLEDGRPAARGIVRLGLFEKDGSRIDPNALFAELGCTRRLPEPDAEIRDWSASVRSTLSHV